MTVAPRSTGKKSDVVQTSRLKGWASHNGPYMTLLIVTALLMTLPFWAGFSSFVMDTMILAGIFTIVAVGLNLLFGYAGQISLGHAAFVGIGA